MEVLRVLGEIRVSLVDRVHRTPLGLIMQLPSRIKSSVIPLSPSLSSFYSTVTLSWLNRHRPLDPGTSYAFLVQTFLSIGTLNPPGLGSNESPSFQDQSRPPCYRPSPTPPHESFVD